MYISSIRFVTLSLKLVIANLVCEVMPMSQNPVVSMNTETNERLEALCSLDHILRVIYEPPINLRASIRVSTFKQTHG